MARNPKKTKKGKKSGGKSKGGGAPAVAAAGAGPSSSSGAAARSTDVDMAGTAPPPERPKVWRPGVDEVMDGEEMRFDPSAYDCLHAFRLPWPCLSFDVLRDPYGDDRKQFPHAFLCVAGTQAATAGDNTVTLMRLSNLTRMKQRRNRMNADGEDEDEDDDEDSSDDEEDEEADAGATSGKQPVLQVRSVAHHGGVNRIRCMPQQPQVCATWGDTARVQLWDMTPQMRQLTADVGAGGSGAGTAAGASAAAGGGGGADGAAAAVARQAPVHIFGGHEDEGFAVDWSPVLAGRLATGDCAGSIYKWDAGEGAKWAVDKTPFRGHNGSVEDIQWSPTEADVFASGGVDGHICIWDARAGDRGTAALRLKAHDADINVISWNRLASCMVASGCDDGSFRIWDLRAPKADGFVAHFRHHTRPITAIEWSPHESSTLATSCADNQITVWDLSLERDAEEEAEFEAQQQQPQAMAPDDLPPQLLFVHYGQTDIKELHWHPQISGLLLSTAADGFNTFRPSNL